MQHQPNDYTAGPYYNYPPPPLQNPNSAFYTDHANPYASASASAPPLTSSYSPASEYPQNYQNYPPYSQNSQPTPPTAPSNPNPSLHHSQSFAQYESHHAPQYYPPYDQNQNPSTTNYAPVAPPNPSLNQPSYSQVYSSAPYSSIGSMAGHGYDVPYDNSPKFDQVRGYLDDRYGGGYNPSRVDSGSEYFGRQAESGLDYNGKRLDVGYDDGAYAYQGKVEPYGARGTVPKSSNSTLFDDYGRPIGASNVKDSSGSSAKIVRAVPKADTQEDVRSGVQKFRVKLLPESGSQSAMDVLCQVGLDGIRMLDPSTSRILRIYPLENITRCEVFDSSTFSFWSKSPVDIEARRIRLQSNRYTTNTLLDTVTAATVQFKEMGGRGRPVETVKTTEQTAEKKRGFGDWMKIMKPLNEEKDHWVPDEAVAKCTACGTDFGAFVRRHHCRNCGDIFCDKCTQGRIALTAEENAQPVRVCDRCMAEVTHRLSTAKEAASKSASFQSHEDLAKKLQEEMERNRKASSGSKSDGSGRRMKEVACPICTVHLQVQVPTSGSETIECGVCQHPFLVSAH